MNQYLLCLCMQDNDYIVDSLCAQKHVLPAHVQQELSVKTETVTPWWWGIKTLIKVRGLTVPTTQTADHGHVD